MNHSEQPGPNPHRVAAVFPARRTHFFLALLLGLCGLLPLAKAESVGNISNGEMALLPTWCQDVQGIKYGDAYYNTSPRAAHWVGLMGKSFWAMHHHCWALIHMHRAQFADTAQSKKSRLMSAVNDFQYVVNNSTPDFIMLPEVFLRMGDAYAMMEDWGNAMQAYTKSRERKPDYWPAYAHWARAQEQAGLKAKALLTLEEGLRVMPGEPNLLKAYAKLGGNADALSRRRPAANAAAPSTASASGARVTSATSATTASPASTVAPVVPAPAAAVEPAVVKPAAIEVPAPEKPAEPIK